MSAFPKIPRSVIQAALLALIVSTLQVTLFLRSAIAAEITMRNDLSDEDKGHIIRIEGVRSTAGQKNYRVTLNPGDSVTIPGKNITGFTAVRQYDTYAKKYEVTCPGRTDVAVKTKLIDIHLDKMSGGCTLMRVGRSTPGGGTVWQK